MFYDFDKDSIPTAREIIVEEKKWDYLKSKKFYTVRKKI